MRIYIPSYARQYVRTVEYLQGEEIVLVLRQGEPVPRHIPSRQDKITVERLPLYVDGIADTRKEIGLMAAANKEPVFMMMDDDLRILARRRIDGRLADLTRPKDMMKEVKALLKMVPSVSISARFGNTFVREDFRLNGRQTQATAYRTDVYNNELKFGESEYFEDALRTIQLFQAGHQNAVLYNYAIEPGRMNTPGGCSTWRTWDGMKADADNLAAKYPNIVTSILKVDKDFFPEKGTRPDIRVKWAAARKQSET